VSIAHVAVPEMRFSCDTLPRDCVFSVDCRRLKWSGSEYPARESVFRQLSTGAV
jgi:hypothetical protein